MFKLKYRRNILVCI